MKKIFLAIFMAAGACLTITGQQTVNDINAEKRAIGSFHGIEVGTGVELFLTAGNTEEIAVSASKPEFREKLITRVENGVLKIYYESKTGSVNKTKESKDLKAYVSYKTLDLLDATTGATIKVSGTLSSSSLEMKANTGASVEGEVNITKLMVTQSTGSKISLSGKADELVVEGLAVNLLEKICKPLVAMQQ
jgi:N-acetylmuramoyl-L-alanine amidase CwlA